MADPKRCIDCPYRGRNYIYEYCTSYGDKTVTPCLTDEEIYDKRPDWCTKFGKSEDDNHEV